MRPRLQFINMTAPGVVPVIDIITTVGAVGDGVHDDTPAFLAAAERANTLGVPIYMPKPPVAYLVDETIPVYDGAVWLGENNQETVIRYSGTGYLFENATPATRIFNVQFKDFQISIIGADPTGGILYNDISLAFTENVSVFGTGIGNKTCFRIEGAVGGNAVYNYFVHCRGLSADIAFDVAAIGSNDTHFHDCRATLCTYGVRVVDSNHVVIHQSAIEDCTYGVWINSTTSALSDGLTVHATRFEGNTTANIFSNGTNVRYPQLGGNLHVTGTAVAGNWSFSARMPSGSTGLNSMFVESPNGTTPFWLERTVAAVAGGALTVRDSNTGSGTPTTLALSSGRSPGHALSISLWNGTIDTENAFITAAGDMTTLSHTITATGSALIFSAVTAQILLGDGTNNGNTGFDLRKGAGNNTTFFTFRNGTTAAGIRGQLQFDSLSNINYLMYDASGNLLGIRPVSIRYNAVNGRGGLGVSRFWADRGTALVSGNFALSAGWGTTATVVPDATSTDMRGNITVTSNGTGQAASPTITLTFSNGTWTTAPHGVFIRNGGTGIGVTGFLLSFTATTMVLTAVGTPIAGETYILNWMLMG